MVTSNPFKRWRSSTPRWCYSESVHWHISDTCYQGQKDSINGITTRTQSLPSDIQVLEIPYHRILVTIPVEVLGETRAYENMPKLHDLKLRIRLLWSQGTPETHKHFALTLSTTNDTPESSASMGTSIIRKATAVHIECCLP